MLRAARHYFLTGEEREAGHEERPHQSEDQAAAQVERRGLGGQRGGCGRCGAGGRLVDALDGRGGEVRPEQVPDACVGGILEQERHQPGHHPQPVHQAHPRGAAPRPLAARLAPPPEQPHQPAEQRLQGKAHRKVEDPGGALPRPQRLLAASRPWLHARQQRISRAEREPPLSADEAPRPASQLRVCASSTMPSIVFIDAATSSRRAATRAASPSSAISAAAATPPPPASPPPAASASAPPNDERRDEAAPSASSASTSASRHPGEELARGWRGGLCACEG